MTDIKLPLVATSDHPEFPVLAWSALELAEINRLMREAVRLNAQAVPDGWKLVPVEPTPDMCKAAVIYANGNAVYKNVAHKALEIEESIYSEVYAAMLSAASAAPQPAQQPLTDEQIKAIYTQETGSLIDDSPWALVDFVRAIEQAHGIGVKND